MSAYERLLANYEISANDDLIQSGIALAALQGVWHSQASVDHHEIPGLERETNAFYEGNKDLFATVNTTTGDTPKQLADLTMFVNSHRTELTGERVLDVGCGDGIRMTTPMADMLPDTDIVGIDICPPASDAHPDIVFQEGNICDLSSVEDGSVRLVTAHWSVVNDLVARTQQLRAFKEVARVTEPGGLLYFDVPSLEGDGGYEALARTYHRRNPDQLFGRIERTFPGGRTKKFHIYPATELRAMLDLHDYKVEAETMWQTAMGQMRRTYIARLGKSACGS